MSNPFAGKLSSWRTIWVRCGRCLRWELVKRDDEPWGSHEDAAKTLRALGWSKTNRRGWTCPDCLAVPSEAAQDSEAEEGKP